MPHGLRQGRIESTIGQHHPDSSTYQWLLPFRYLGERYRTSMRNRSREERVAARVRPRKELVQQLLVLEIQAPTEKQLMRAYKLHFQARVAVQCLSPMAFARQAGVRTCAISFIGSARDASFAGCCVDLRAGTRRAGSNARMAAVRGFGVRAAFVLLAEFVGEVLCVEMGAAVAVAVSASCESPRGLFGSVISKEGTTVPHGGGSRRRGCSCA